MCKLGIVSGPLCLTAIVTRAVCSCLSACLSLVLLQVKLTVAIAAYHPYILICPGVPLSLCLLCTCPAWISRRAADTATGTSLRVDTAHFYTGSKFPFCVSTLRDLYYWFYARPKKTRFSSATCWHVASWHQLIGDLVQRPRSALHRVISVVLKRSEAGGAGGKNGGDSGVNKC